MANMNETLHIRRLASLLDECFSLPTFSRVGKSYSCNCKPNHACPTTVCLACRIVEALAATEAYK